jgi:hypothetical protein
VFRYRSGSTTRDHTRDPRPAYLPGPHRHAHARRRPDAVEPRHHLDRGGHYRPISANPRQAAAALGVWSKPDDRGPPRRRCPAAMRTRPAPAQQTVPCPAASWHLMLGTQNDPSVAVPTTMAAKPTAMQIGGSVRGATSGSITSVIGVGVTLGARASDTRAQRRCWALRVPVLRRPRTSGVLWRCSGPERARPDRRPQGCR